jgi:hypothetical protein
MARALRRGEEVEIPGGTLQAVSQKKPVIRKWQKARNANGQVSFRIHKFNRRRTVIQFRPDPKFRWEQE